MNPATGTAVGAPTSGPPAAGAALLLRPMTVADVEDVYQLETSVFPHPWSRANFLDSLSSGYDAWVLCEPGTAQSGARHGAIAGYFLLMYAPDEAHLLDVALRGALQGRGIGRYLLDQIAARARTMCVESVLLEVRPSNQRALRIYREYGYAEIGRRKGYYPAAAGQREDAIVMRYAL